MNIKINKDYSEDNVTDNLDFDFDDFGERPSWIHIKTPEFKSRFIVIQTPTQAEVLYKRFTGNFYYPVDLVQQPDEEKRFYNEYAKYYDEFTTKNNLPMAQFLLEKLSKYQRSKTAKILDAGSGTGIFSNFASENGFTDLTLLDISESMLKEAKNKPLLEKANFVIGDIETVQLPGIYDSVVSIMMFDHLDDLKLEKSLENIYSHLSKDAYIFLIADKKRDLYSKFFTEIESGLFIISEGKDFKKYYFVGKVKK